MLRNLQKVSVKTTKFKLSKFKIRLRNSFEMFQFIFALVAALVNQLVFFIEGSSCVCGLDIILLREIIYMQDNLSARQSVCNLCLAEK